MTTYHVLSLDGGGIRGYLSILLLERLEKERPGFINSFDLFAGTSTGSIIAIALASGLTPTEVRSLYENKAKAIFHDSLFDNVRDLGFTLGAKYGNKNLKKILTEYFGDGRLDDLEKRVLIASFDLDHTPKDKQEPRMWKAKFFHNYPGDDSDGCQRMVDVILRSSAAPFYFPSYQGYVDGFVIANNPSMCALAQVLDVFDLKTEAISLLSVGTGLNPRYIEDENADWGWFKWMIQFHPLHRQWYALPLVYMMWEGGIELVNFQCRQILKDNFHRLDPLLPKLVDIDDLKRMKVLRQVALKTDLDETLGWVDEQFDALTLPIQQQPAG